MSGVGQLEPVSRAGLPGIGRGYCAAARLVLALALIGNLGVFISACGSGGGNGEQLGERVIPLGQPVPKGGGRYQIGKPYQVAGGWYHPREELGYKRVGRASWYGELFHGRRTANGEIYDMDRLTAAHPTLPLPVYARVTNLNNGRTIVVRVNDRGPYALDRVIDLSRRSAEVLGFRRHGTATVRVEYLGRAPLNGDDSYERRYLASQGWMQVASRRKPRTMVQDPIAMASLPGENSPPAENSANPASPPEGAVLAGPAGSDAANSLAWETTMEGFPLSKAAAADPAMPTGSLGPRGKGPLIQAGSFKSKENAEKARAALATIAPVEIAQIDVGGDTYFRVRVGPFAGQAEAKAALPRISQAGFQGARIIPAK